MSSDQLCIVVELEQVHIARSVWLRIRCHMHANTTHQGATRSSFRSL